MLLSRAVPFVEQNFYDCGLEVAEALLKYYGYEIALILHDQWFLEYSVSDTGFAQIRARSVPMRQCYEARGFSSISHSEECAEAGWESMRSRLASDHPVIVLADVFYLERYYYPGWGHHGGHYIIVDGQDDRRRKVHIVDPSPSKWFRGWIPMDGYNRAWGSDAIDPFTWVELILPVERFKMTADRARRAILDSVTTMLAGQSESQACLGLAVFERLLADLTEWRSLEGQSVDSRLRWLFDQTLAVLRERGGYARFLRAASGNPGLEQLEAVAQGMQSIVQGWYTMRSFCVRGGDREDRLAQITNRLTRIWHLEKRLLLGLEEAVDSTDGR